MLPLLSLLHSPAVRLDVRALANLVPLRDPGGPQWPGMVGPANGPGATALCPPDQQVPVDPRLDAGPAVAGPATADRLGARPGCLATATPTVASAAPGEDA